MARMEPPRVAVLGAGPVGLEAALCASALNLPFAVYERGRVGEYLRRWGHVRMFSPVRHELDAAGPRRIRADHPQHPLPEAGAILTGREHLAAYLEPLALAPALTPAVHENTAVLHVGRRGLLKGDHPGDARRGREPFRLFCATTRAGRASSLPTSCWTAPASTATRALGDGGLPALGEAAARPTSPSAWRTWPASADPFYADKTTLVIGSGYSAATTVCTLSPWRKSTRRRG